MAASTRKKNVSVSRWLSAVRKLIEQVEEWAAAEGWSVHRQDKEIHEERLGDYTAPMLRMRSPGGELYLTPIALDILGRGEGRVDLEAWPTLNRVKRIREKDRWKIITDSNVPLRVPWNQKSFVQLVHDLQQ